MMRDLLQVDAPQDVHVAILSNEVLHADCAKWHELGIGRQKHFPLVRVKAHGVMLYAACS